MTDSLAADWLATMRAHGLDADTASLVLAAQAVAVRTIEDAVRDHPELLDRAGHGLLEVLGWWAGELEAQAEQ